MPLAGFPIDKRSALLLDKENMTKYSISPMSSLYELYLRHRAFRRTPPHRARFRILRAWGRRSTATASQPTPSKGAAYAVVDDPSLPNTRPDKADRLIVVDDALQTLQALAREHRRELGLPILTITGSNGKTTTKELVSRVLAEKYEVYATRGNLNNHIGVPLTLLAMTRDVEFGIVEMGASACGEIALLCSIAEPNYGIVTNIGRAHLEGFGGPEGVRRGKGELYDWLARTGGRVFVPANDPVLMSMAAERETLAAECYPTTLADGVEHHLEGDYNRFNVAAAVAVGRYFGVDDERIRYAVGSYRPDNHRSQKIRTGQNTLILDCYNANPSSMQASLVNFRQEPLESCTRKILILGDMLELGDWSDAEHRHIISLAAEIPDARILLVGPHFAKAYRSLESRPADTTLPVAGGTGRRASGNIPYRRP